MREYLKRTACPISSRPPIDHIPYHSRSVYWFKLIASRRVPSSSGETCEDQWVVIYRTNSRVDTKPTLKLLSLSISSCIAFTNQGNPYARDMLERTSGDVKGCSRTSWVFCLGLTIQNSFWGRMSRSLPLVASTPPGAVTPLHFDHGFLLRDVQQITRKRTASTKVYTTVIII